MSMDQGCESNTPPLVLLDLWSSGLNCTTNNINSNSSTTNTKCTLTSTFSKYSTLLLLNVFPMLLAVCCTCHRVLLSIVSAGKAEGVGKGRAMRSGRPAAPKKKTHPKKRKSPKQFRTLSDSGFWNLDVGFWMLDFRLYIYSSDFLPKFGFLKDIPRPRQLGGWWILEQFCLQVL